MPQPNSFPGYFCCLSGFFGLFLFFFFWLEDFLFPRGKGAPEHPPAGPKGRAETPIPCTQIPRAAPSLPWQLLSILTNATSCCIPQPSVGIFQLLPAAISVCPPRNPGLFPAIVSQAPLEQPEHNGVSHTSPGKAPSGQTHPSPRNIFLISSLLERAG